MKGMQGGNGWGREGEERVAAWSATGSDTLND